MATVRQRSSSSIEQPGPRYLSTLLSVVLLVLVLSGRSSATDYQALARLCDTLVVHQEIDSASTLAERTLQNAVEEFGPDDTVVASWTNRLAITCFHRGDYDRAGRLWEQALRIWTDKLGPDDVSVAITYNNLGTLRREQGDFDNALPLFQKALKIWETNFGPDDPRVAPATNNLGYTLHQLGRFQEAEALYKRSIRLWTDAYGETYHNAVRAWNNLANLYKDRGQYAEAELIYRKTLKLTESTLGSSHPDVGYCLNNLGYVCWSQARYSEARDYYQRALEVYTAAFGEDHPYLSYCLTGLSAVQWETGNYSEAEKLLRRTLQLRAKAFGEDNVDYAQTLNDLGVLYFHWRKFDKVEELHKRALEIRLAAFGPSHPLVAQSKHNLADYYKTVGQLDVAERYNREAIEIWKDVLGPHHPELGLGYTLRSSIFAARGEIEKAREAAWEAFDINRYNMERNARVLSEKDALHYNNLLRRSLDNYLSIVLSQSPVSEDETRRACEALVTSKGRVSDQIFLRRRVLESENDSTLTYLRNELTYLKHRLAVAYTAGPQSSLEDYDRELSKMSRVVDSLDSQIARLTGNMKNSHESQSVRLDDVLAHRPVGGALLDFYRLNAHQDSTILERAVYVALVVTPEGDIHLLDLGPAETIDSQVVKYRGNFSAIARTGGIITDSIAQVYQEINSSLYALVWRPVSAYVRGAGSIVISGDADLNLLSFGALKRPDGRYLLEDYILRYVSALRDLARRGDQKVTGRGLLAVGDPDFFATAKERSSAVAGTANSDSLFRRHNHELRSSSGDPRFPWDLLASPLPGTRREIQRVSESWSRLTTEPCVVLLGARASEEMVRKEAPGKRIVHFATHGYYLDGDDNQKVQERPGDIEIVTVHPLLKSGILLAGANLHGSDRHSPTSDDGSLTAYEVAELELNGTELVVLSACESGLGQPVSGEGLYGLRRAFQIAGAHSVISAMWAVSDNATVDIISGLYSDSGSTITERLRTLQLQALARQRSSGGEDHPYDWGAFLLVGEE